MCKLNNHCQYNFDYECIQVDAYFNPNKRELDAKIEYFNLVIDESKHDYFEFNRKSYDKNFLEIIELAKKLNKSIKLVLK